MHLRIRGVVRVGSGCRGSFASMASASQHAPSSGLVGPGATLCAKMLSLHTGLLMFRKCFVSRLVVLSYVLFCGLSCGVLCCIVSCWVVVLYGIVL